MFTKAVAPRMIILPPASPLALASFVLVCRNCLTKLLQLSGVVELLFIRNKVDCDPTVRRVEIILRAAGVFAVEYDKVLSGVGDVTAGVEEVIVVADGF